MFSPPAQKIEVSVHPAGTVSVTVLVPSWVPSRLNTLSWVLGEVVRLVLPTPEPEPLKLNVPFAPTVFLIRSREAFWVLVNVQLAESPAATSIVAATSPAVKLECG